MRSRWLNLLCAVVATLALLSVPAAALADKVVLKDGTVIQGTVIKRANGDVWVKPTDGSDAKTIPAPLVDKVESTEAEPGTAAPAAGPAFASVKAKAEKVEKAIDAVVLWQSYLDKSNPQGDDLTKAEAELKTWTDRADEDAEKINGKWIGGVEKEKIVDKVRGLLGEYRELSKQNQTLAAVKKLEEAAKIYPNAFEVQFYLGVVSLEKEDGEKAISYFEACRRLRPRSTPVLNNLAVGYFFKKQYDKSINLLDEAVRSQDIKEVVQNAVTAFANLPGNMANAGKYKTIRQNLNLLAGRHGITSAGKAFHYLPMEAGKAGPTESEEGDREGVVGNGSGFIISADGLILTNKHVAGGGDAVLIKFNDGTQKTGEIVVIDDDQDLALIRVKSDKPFPFVKLGKYDNPGDGEECTIMGYPVSTFVGWVVKTTSGHVSAGNNAKFTSDVTLDAKVNPGNSGGPVYDRYGNVMAIIAQKTKQQEGGMIDTYGLAISNGRIRKFLAKNNVTTEAGESSGTPLTVAEVAEKNKPATVCILIVKTKKSKGE